MTASPVRSAGYAFLQWLTAQDPAERARRRGLKPIHKTLMAVIAQHQGYNDACRAAQNTIILDADVARSSGQAALEDLVEYTWIARSYVPGRNGPEARYSLTLELGQPIPTRHATAERSHRMTRPATGRLPARLPGDSEDDLGDVTRPATGHDPPGYRATTRPATGHDPPGYRAQKDQEIPEKIPEISVAPSGAPERPHARGDLEEDEEPGEGEDRWVDPEPDTAPPSSRPAAPPESASPAPASRPRRAARARPTKRAKSVIPADWAPTEQHRTLAAQLGLDADRAAVEFVSFWQGEGRPKKDWNATFTNRLYQLVDRPGYAKAQPRGPSDAWPGRSAYTASRLMAAARRSTDCLVCKGRIRGADEHPENAEPQWIYGHATGERDEHGRERIDWSGGGARHVACVEPPAPRPRKEPPAFDLPLPHEPRHAAGWSDA